LRAVRASFEILNSKHETRNKSKIQNKNVQNEEVHWYEWYGYCLAMLSFARLVTTLALATCGVRRLRFWSFGFSVSNLFRISDFELRI